MAKGVRRDGHGVRSGRRACRSATGASTGDQLTFEVDVTDPMELTLAAKLTIDGDTLSGKAKAKGKLLPVGEGRRGTRA